MPKCFNCGSPYHKKRDCTKLSNSSRGHSSQGGKVECYQCREKVYDLREHKKSCSKNSQNHKSVYNSTVECYDCHQQVVNLKNHRQVCSKSRHAKSAIVNSSMLGNVISSVTVDYLAAARNLDTTDFYMLLDVSSSMSGHRLKEAKSALTGIYNTMNENDRISIVSFDTKAYFKLKPRPVGQIRCQNEMPDTLNRIFARGATAIWDAIYMTFNQIQDKFKKTLIIVLTDGEDNSSEHTFDEVSKLIKQYENISLNIVHIDGKSNPQYEHLCNGRGEYSIIKEADIVVEVTRIFVKFYN